MAVEGDKFNFEKLEVYQKALDFVDIVYRTTENYPKDEKFIFVDQFRRAALSVPLNIAEGCGNSDLIFKRYLSIAKGSIRECVALITLSFKRNYLTKDADLLRASCVELSRMISGLIKSLS